MSVSASSSQLRLESLQLQGFKSFAERTLVSFPHRITAIVGPNGSGKSNVFDALRWTLGGGRAAQFRAQDKTDLIFHGSAGKKAMGFAEVEVVMQKGSESLRIKRNLNKEGSSKLTIGGKNARFLDLEDALAGSGLGRANLAVIGQGEIGEVLMAEPSKLLAYVAEAAGVARLGGRRESTLSKLATSREHLQRLQDIAVELEQQCQQLRAAAAEAARHQALRREQLSLRYTVVYRRRQALETELNKLSEQQTEAEGALESGEAALQRAEQAYQQCRLAYEQLEERYRAALQDYEAKKAALKLAEQHHQHLEQALKRLVIEQARVKQDMHNLQQHDAPQAPAADAEQLLAQLQEVSAQCSQQQEKVQAAVQQLQTSQQNLRQLEQAQQNYQQHLIRYEQRKQQLEQDIQQLEQQLASLESADARHVQQLEQAYQQKYAILQEKEQQLQELREKLQVQQHDLAQVAADVRVAERDYQRLEASYRNRQGYAQGARHALQSGIEGMLGSVADILTIAADYQLALSSALGRRIENVVVRDSQVAQQVLAYVKGQGGYVTLWPLELIRQRHPRDIGALAQEQGVYGTLISHASYAPEYRHLVEQLLGNTTVVEDSRLALQLAKRYAQRPRLVTLQGDLLESSGALSGGKRRTGGQSSVMLGLQQAIATAKSQLEQAQANAAQIRAAVQASQIQSQTLQAELATLRPELAEISSAMRQAREEQLSQHSKKEAWQEQQQSLEQALATLQAPEKVQELADYQTTLEQVQQQEKSLEQERHQLEQQRQAQAERQQAYALHQEKVRSYQQALQQYQQAQQQLEALEQRLQALRQQEEEGQQELQNAQANRARASAALPQKDSHAEHPEQIQQRFALSKEQRQAAEQTLQQQSRQQIALQQKLESIKLSVARKETGLEEASSQWQQFPEGIPLADEAKTSKQHKDRLARVERELAAMGAVNHRAQLELTEQEARLKELLEQMAEAESACQELETLLDDIDTEVTSRLGDALGQLEQHFQQQAVMLFGEGAQAGLDIHYEQQRPTGLSLRLQPPNKRTAALRLLSVGERSMGAMAFLFALMSAGESASSGAGLPLAILDEVDAPLDEANIRRFCHFLQERAKLGTQFILVTHQKATMEIADALWGVTTRQGVSQVFSIGREDAEKMGAVQGE